VDLARVQLVRALYTLLLVTGVTAVVIAEGAVAAPSRIVDRTFRCTPAVLYGAVRQLDVTTSPRGSLGAGGRSDDVSPGYISVGSGAARGVFDDLVFARARSETRHASTPLPPGVYVDARRCARARVRLPLSPKGLPGAPIRFDREADCEVRGRVLVRVRAVLDAPAAWQPASPPWAGTRRNVVEATIAVRSERTRRPLALLGLNDAGATRLWFASACG
jgi:hypothetical protein